MTDDYCNIGNLSQQERWRIWQESQKESMGSYTRMRDEAELNTLGFLR
jgi:hypothetical protein